MIPSAINKACILVVTAVMAAWIAVPDATAGGRFPDTIRIAPGQKLPNRTVNVGLNRSLVVELGEDATDILVSSPAIADAVIKSSRRVYILGVTAGQSSVFIFGRGGRQIANFEISVQPDTDDLHRMLRSLLPDSNISISSVNGSVVLSGTVANALDAKRAADIAAKFVGGENSQDRVVNMIAARGSEQVHLKVVIAEVRRDLVRQLGVDLSGAITRGSFALSALTSNPFSVVGNPITDSLLNIARTGGDVQGSATVRALQEDGVVRLLAEPTLTAISGESASFLVGGEFPIPVGVDDNTVTIEFKEFGVGLNFTPLVLSGGRINLKIKTEVSEVSSDNSVSISGGSSSSSLVVPGISVRRADTVVELPSGGSLVLAGLIKDDQRQSISGIPGLLQVPILGALFKSRDFQRSQTELVVFVTPYLVDPVATSDIRRPDKNLKFTDDATAYFLNRLNRVYRSSDATGDVSGYRGSFGFFFE